MDVLFPHIQECCDRGRSLVTREGINVGLYRHAKMCLCSGIPNGIKQFFPASIRAIDAGDHSQKEIGDDMGIGLISRMVLADCTFLLYQCYLGHGSLSIESPPGFANGALEIIHSSASVA